MDKSCWNQIFFFCLSLSICFSLSKPHPSISIWELLLPQLDMTQQDCHSWCQECGYMTLTRSIIPYFSVFQRLKKKIRWNLVAGIGDKGSILTETDIYQLFKKKNWGEIYKLTTLQCVRLWHLVHSECRTSTAPVYCWSSSSPKPRQSLTVIPPVPVSKMPVASSLLCSI